MDESERRRRERIDFEMRLLAHYRFRCQAYERDGLLYVEERVKPSNRWRRFKLRLVVPPRFPYAKPDLLVVSPRKLPMHGGRSTLNELGSSYAFHTSGTSPDGYVAISHTRAWEASVSLAQVLKKGVLWVELYGQHCETGLTIDQLLQRALANR